MDVVAVFIATSNILAIGTVLAQAGIIAFVVLWRSRPSHTLMQWVLRRAYLLAFLVALGGMVSSLFYSEILGFAPCALCWYQRIVLYPQVILFGVALWKRERRIADYGLALSVVGVVIAGYQYAAQMFGVPLVSGSCATGEGAVSCLEKYFVEFGYVTIPLMAFTAFAMLVVLMLAARRMER